MASSSLVSILGVKKGNIDTAAVMVKVVVFVAFNVDATSFVFVDSTRPDRSPATHRRKVN